MGPPQPFTIWSGSPKDKDRTPQPVHDLVAVPFQAARQLIFCYQILLIKCAIYIELSADLGVHPLQDSLQKG